MALSSFIWFSSSLIFFKFICLLLLLFVKSIMDFVCCIKFYLPFLMTISLSYKCCFMSWLRRRTANLYWFKLWVDLCNWTVSLIWNILYRLELKLFIFELNSCSVLSILSTSFLFLCSTKHFTLLFLLVCILFSLFRSLISTLDSDRSIFLRYLLTRSAYLPSVVILIVSLC